MHKYINLSIFYAIVAMIGGVFYREFTKWNDFTGVTALGKVHVHLFALGMLLFLIVSLFVAQYDLEKYKTFRLFLWLYNIGLVLTVVMFVVRGIVEVRMLVISSSVDSAISGIAGIGHMLTGIGIILLLLSLKKIAKN